MGQIRLYPIAQEQGVGRGVFSGEMGGSGFFGGDGGSGFFGADDCLCGHCDTVMFMDFNPHMLVGDFVFQCSVCSEFNESPAEEAFQQLPLEDSEDLPPEDT